MIIILLKLYLISQQLILYGLVKGGMTVAATVGGGSYCGSCRSSDIVLV